MAKEELKSLGNCQVCFAPYRAERAVVLEKNDEAVTIHVDCAKCASSALVTIYSGVKGLVTSVGVPTDLSKSDLERIKKSKRVTHDEVLELHAFLERSERKNKK